jgi:hypothetical protein
MGEGEDVGAATETSSKRVLVVMPVARFGNRGCGNRHPQWSCG